MWKLLLKLIPFEQLILIVAKVLTGLSDYLFGKLWDSILYWISKAEQVYGNGKGKEKFEFVKRKIESYYPEVRTWVINFLIEFGVAYLKKKGVIK